MRSFRGSEPAVEIGGHLLAERNWFAASAGFQGVPDLSHATGSLTLARAFPSSLGTLTPRLVAARGPLATFPLPLSLGLFSKRGEAVLAWRASSWMAEGGARVDSWEAGTVPGRVQNAALTAIEPGRSAFAKGKLVA